MTAGGRIMETRTKRGYTRGQLACMAQISEKFLYEIETDRKGFSATTLVRIAQALEVSLDYIMYGTGNNEKQEEAIAVLERFRPDTRKRLGKLLDVVYEIAVEESRRPS